jgi:hypothetical protein
MKTAVEWLLMDYANKGVITIEAIEQAKEMENKQLFLASNTSAKEAYKAGQKSMYCGCYEISGCTTYEDWLYDKTFKSE